MRDTADVRFIQIAVGQKSNYEPILFALDEGGRVWARYTNYGDSVWEEVPNHPKKPL